MRGYHRFDPSMRERLSNPTRFDGVPPDALWRALAVANPAVLLDLGAGTGFYTEALGAFAPDAVIHALDVEPLMFEELRKRFEDRPRFRPRLISDHRTGLTDSSLDGAWMVNVFHELADLSSTLRELLTVLRPAGRLLIVDWERDEAALEHGPPLSHRIAADDVVGWLASAGFVDIAVDKRLTDHYSIHASRMVPGCLEPGAHRQV